MAHWKTESALFQAEADLLAANEHDRRLIDGAKRRIEGRTRLIKVMRRRWRKQGLVNVSGDSMSPHWVRRDFVD